MMIHHSWHIGVLGATGMVGRKFINLLAESDIHVSSLICLASHRSTRQTIFFRGHSIPVIPLIDKKEEKDLMFSEYMNVAFKSKRSHLRWNIQDSVQTPLKEIIPDTVQTFIKGKINWSALDVLFVAAPAAIARIWIPIALKHGVTVIDKSSAFRLDPSVPLVVPEVNGASWIKRWKHAEVPLLIASPNCVAGPLSLPLSCIQKKCGLKRVYLSTYQSVSGAGRLGMDSLFEETKALITPMTKNIPVFERRMAHNVLPVIGTLDSKGVSSEEKKIQDELRILLEMPELPIHVTSVRVPVFIGHSAVLTIETEHVLPPVTLWREIFESQGVLIVDQEQEDNDNSKPIQDKNDFFDTCMMTSMNNIDTTTSFQDHKDVLVKIQNFQEKYHPEAYEEHMTGNDLNQNKHSFKEHDGENNLQVSNNASNHQHRFATPYEVQGDDGIYISRLRRDDDHHLSFWGTWDNTLRGAASDLFDVFFMLINRKY